MRRFFTVKGVELDFIEIDNNISTDQGAEVAPSAELISPSSYQGVGAYMDGPADFRDLEANAPGNFDASNKVSKTIMTPIYAAEQLADVASPQENAHMSNKMEIENDISSLSSEASGITRTSITPTTAVNAFNSEESFGSDSNSASDSTASDTDSDQSIADNGAFVLSYSSDSVDYSFPSSCTEDGD